MKLIDISHTLNQETPIYPGDYKTSITTYKTIEKDHYSLHLLTSCLHTGTHIDMPMHLIHDDRTADMLPIDNFIGKGVLLDVRGESCITMKPAYEQMIIEGSIVLLFTGFDKYYFTDDYFTKHPAVSDELAGFFISRKIKMLGIDMPAPDYPPFYLHKELLANDIFILENLTNLQSLTGITDFEVIALPLKIQAEASFVRAVCRIK